MNEHEMKEQARLERNRYQREYRAKNPERIRAINAKYWINRAKKREEEKHDAAKTER